MARLRANYRLQSSKGVGWKAAMLEFEHQAAHWDTPDHGETGHLIGQALRAAVDIARSCGLHCAHRTVSERLGDGSRPITRRSSLRRPEKARRQTGLRRAAEHRRIRGT